MINRYALQQTLEAAAEAHHEYQTVALGGETDQQWPVFYAAYALGRLGEFMEPSALAASLEAVQAKDNWAGAAAEEIANAL
jgi:hypothetical protein